MPADRAAARAAYAFALVLGVVLALWIFPLGTIFPTDPRVATYYADQAQHIIGQRYFIADAWHWPLLQARGLGGPDGVNIAFTDSQPLLALAAKLLRGWLPAGFHTITLWLAICWVMQPIAAVFALRSSGQTRLLPAVTVAVLAANMPSWYLRWGHSALCGHFLLLFALGLSIRMVRGCRTAGPAAAMLAPVSLLVHPYLMAMILVVLGAAPLTLLLQWRWGWLRAAGWVGLGAVLTGICIVTLGYNNAALPGDSGYFSMNLLSPVYPALSTFFPYFPTFLDATGGQQEGYQYLGIGVLLLLAFTVLACGRQCVAAVRAYPGLALVMLALTVFAASSPMYVGTYAVVHYDPLPISRAFRASGRFFWPVAYILVVGCVAACARGFARSRFYSAAMALLIGFSLLQAADVQALRAAVISNIRTPPSPGFDRQIVRDIFSTHRELTILPPVGCGSSFDPAVLMPIILIASEFTMAVNTMYVARPVSQIVCPTTSDYARPLGSKEVRVYYMNALPNIALVFPDAARDCRALGAFAFCARSLAGRQDLLPVAAALPVFPVGVDLGFGKGQPGAVARGIGWSGNEPSGTWTDGREAQLGFNVAVPGPLRFSVQAAGFVPAGAAAQRVTVYAGAVQIAVWEVSGGLGSYQAVIPASARQADGGVLLHFDIGAPTTPLSLGKGQDDRSLGMFLNSVRIDPADGAG